MSNTRPWAIVRIQGFQLLAKDCCSFTSEQSEAAWFDTEESANVVARSIKTPLQVIEFKNPPKVEVKSEFDFPGPDYFESSVDHMKLEQLISWIKSDQLINYFDPVDTITGGGQMTGGGVEDPLTGRLVGRRFEFSFESILGDNDMVELGKVIRDSGLWKLYKYVIRRRGFTAYAVLTLISEDK